ncbi:SDR family oxidoreductase [Pararobbsia alpina]|uniref:3-beta-hydroxycholanate 3-dehydrogenase (NADP(+)) n=1 Tax=Pararobbsia alpina TaxID=621374 RepID=A0A6S7CXS4_9BURK|nr:SDR family oxidoreductase [Pararobbsia alpina]CAB3790817.1 3-beta-hydroxycholanate 3-dehydrogenase (NADP(+)) [Pararobbsia alpina]
MSSQAKVALVTGASRGIGRAVAQKLLDHGYRVVVAARALEPLEAFAKAAQDAGHEALAVQADVSDAASVEQLFERTREHFGRLDVLFNNAGIGASAVSIDELSVEQWRAVVDTNLTGVFLCSRAAFRLMKTQQPRGGRIINNGSISSYTPRPFSAPYTSTKHAVAGLTKALSLDGRAFDIACGQIDIGNAATDMTERMVHGVLQANGETAAEPRIDLDHVANAALYMAGLPLEANVQSMTVMATKMPFVGRG